MDNVNDRETRPELPQPEPTELKVSFADVMRHPNEGEGGDHLVNALNRNEADIRATVRRIEEIYLRAEQVHPGGAAGFKADHAVLQA